MNIYATKIKNFKKEPGQIYYQGINERTGKLITVVSYGHLLLKDNWICIFAANAGRFLMTLTNVKEVKDCNTSTIYVCD